MEGSVGAVGAVVAAVLVVLVGRLVYRILDVIFFRPLAILRSLRAQGIPGYPFIPVLGQIPDLMRVEQQRSRCPALASRTWATQFFVDGTDKYGKLWTWSLGFLPRVAITDPALVRQVHITKKASFVQPTITKQIKLLGDGLLVSEGALWARQRRLLTPAFHFQELRKLYSTMVDRAREAVQDWQGSVAARPGQALAMDRELSDLTLSIIIATAFGARLGGTEEARLRDAIDVYFGGFAKMRLFLVFPWLQLLPLQINKTMQRSDVAIRLTMKAIVQERVKEMQLKRSGEGAADGHGPSATAAATRRDGKVAPKRVDLLQLMLESTEGVSVGAEAEQKDNSSQKEKIAAKEKKAQDGGGERMSEQQLIDECVTFLLGGNETTALLLTWTMMLLSQHPEWQDKAREEVRGLDISLDSPPEFDALSQLKVVSCILNETLRLYPPASALGRTCVEDAKLSDAITIPKGCDVVTPIEAIHLSKDLWGTDAREFNPQRFAEGTSKAASEPGAFIPFGLGPRVCIGQNFALIEAKLILSLILCTFSWSTADSYAHHPVVVLATKPKHGMPIVLKPLH